MSEKPQKKITECDIETRVRKFRKEELDGVEFILRRSADGRRLARGRLLPDGSIRFTQGAAPDKAAMRKLEDAAAAFAKKCGNEPPKPDRGEKPKSKPTKKAESPKPKSDAG